MNTSIANWLGYQTNDQDYRGWLYILTTAPLCPTFDHSYGSYVPHTKVGIAEYTKPKVKNSKKAQKKIEYRGSRDLPGIQGRVIELTRFNTVQLSLHTVISIRSTTTKDPHEKIEEWVKGNLTGQGKLHHSEIFTVWPNYARSAVMSLCEKYGFEYCEDWPMHETLSQDINHLYEFDELPDTIPNTPTIQPYTDD